MRTTISTSSRKAQNSRRPPAAAPPPAADARQRIYLEDAFTLSLAARRARRALAAAGAASWEERLFLDAREQWPSATDADSDPTATASTLRAEDGLPFPTHENVVNDFREGYRELGGARPAPISMLGRINLKSGVAPASIRRISSRPAPSSSRSPPIPPCCARTGSAR